MPAKVLHIAGWYPNPWDEIEGNFVRDQVLLFKRELEAEAIVVQVRASSYRWPIFRRVVLADGARGYFLFTALKPGKLTEWLSTILLVLVLLKERAWRFRAFHFHIAYPLLLHSKLWRWVFKKPILISEHWSAYHYNFYLPVDAKALSTLRKPFQQGDAVFAVSQSLLNDVRRFSGSDDFSGFVIPNVVPLHGPSEGARLIPTFFAVNRWVSIKSPMPMLEGFVQAAQSGCVFNLVIGGYGELVGDMERFVINSPLKERARFLGKMTKPQISEQLALSDAYLFSSDYETFSIACAEALGAGVPLIGPDIEAIAEYSSRSDWVRVEARDAESWAAAVACYLARFKAGEFSSAEIARRAENQFSENRTRRKYREAMGSLGLGV